MDEIKIRVLHIMSGFGGGVSSLIRNLGEGIDKDEVTFDVISFTDYPDFFEKVIRNTGGMLFTMPKSNKIIKLMLFYRSVLRQGNYDYIHCHISGYRGLFFRLLSIPSKGMRFLVHAHATKNEDFINSRFGFFEKLNKESTKLTTKYFLSCSKEASLYNYGKKITNSKRIMHIPNGIQINKFLNPDNAFIERFKNEHNLFGIKVIGNVGRFNIQKNHLFLVDVIKELSFLKENFICFLVGEGKKIEEVKRYVDDLDLNDKIIFLGRRNDVEKLYHCFDLFLLPSLWEGLPTVGVEAQASGLPMLLSDTITTEVDLNLGLVDFLSLDDNTKTWALRIQQLLNITKPNKDIIIRKFESYSFDNKSSAKLYLKYLKKEISFYNIK